MLLGDNGLASIFLHVTPVSFSCFSGLQVPLTLTHAISYSHWDPKVKTGNCLILNNRRLIQRYC